MDGFAQGESFHEIGLFEVCAAREADEGADLRRVWPGANLFGQAHMDDVARLTALQQLQCAFTNEAAQGFARGVRTKAEIAGEPGHGKTKTGLPFQARMPEKVGIDGALGCGKMQARGQEVLELFADEFGVGLFGFHDGILERESRKQKAESKKKEKLTADR